MNNSRISNRWFFSPLSQSPHAGIKGAGGDLPFPTLATLGEIPPNPPLQKGGMRLGRHKA